MRGPPIWQTAFVALGSNIEPERHLPRAARRVSELGRAARLSQIWCSRPVGFLAQPDFWNAVVMLDTAHSVPLLRRYLREIEDRLGRRRDPCNKDAPRTIDLDLVDFNQTASRWGNACLPDPDIALRPFLAIPLAELAPDLRHPTLGRTFREIAAALAFKSPPLAKARWDEGRRMKPDG